MQGGTKYPKQKQKKDERSLLRQNIVLLTFKGDGSDAQ
jgi:hypothetical protein